MGRDLRTRQHRRGQQHGADVSTTDLVLRQPKRLRTRASQARRHALLGITMYPAALPGARPVAVAALISWRYRPRTALHRSRHSLATCCAARMWHDLFAALVKDRLRPAS